MFKGNLCLCRNLVNEDVRPVWSTLCSHTTQTLLMTQQTSMFFIFHEQKKKEKKRKHTHNNIKIHKGVFSNILQNACDCDLGENLKQKQKHHSGQITYF